MRILAISDLHTDFRKNWQLVQQLPDTLYQHDTLIVAGDIASHINIIKNTLELLCSKFQHVFYIPGNHEFWVGKGQFSSIDKFLHILKLCDTLGVHVSPARVGKVWIVPLFSWYSSDFDDDGFAYTGQLRAWMDFYACKWPEGLDDIAGYFYNLNQPNILTYDGPIISFSHFVPRPDLLPPRKYLFFKALPQVAGSALIEKQIRQLRSEIHIFGHTHIKRDLFIEGIRYVHNPLSYPGRQSASTFPEKVIWYDN